MSQKDSLPDELEPLTKSLPSVHYQMDEQGNLTQVKNPRRAATELTKDVVDKWKKDIRLLTKVYKSIGFIDDWRDENPEKNKKNEELYMEARRLFANFRKTFESWLDHVVAPKKRKDLSFMQRELVSKGYRATSEIMSMFPTMYDYRTKEHGLPDLSTLVQGRDKKIKRFQLTFNEFFKELDDYLDMYQGKVERTIDPKEVYNIRGVRVMVENRGRDEKEDLGLEKFLDGLQHAVVRIERAGFGAAVQGLTVRVVFDTVEYDTAGKYQPDKDEMTIYFLGFSGDTFTHETGHRYWFRNLGNNARHHWVETLNGRQLTVTAEDVDEFVNDWLARELQERKYVDSERLKARIEKYITDYDDVKLKFLEMAENLPNRDTLPEYEEYFIREWVGRKVSLEKITDYGDTNPVEAYADAFRLYCVEGPNSLKPWSREFFKQVSRDGGAKLAKRIAFRFETRMMRLLDD